MRTAIARIDLGQTRLGVGWVLYDYSTKAFDEMTPREVKLLIKEKIVNGLKLEDDQIVVDEDYFSNFVLKTGVGNYRFIKEAQSKDITIMAVTEVSKSKFGRMYEVITNYYQRFVLTEDKLRHCLKTMVVGGAKIVDGELEIAPGVHRVLVEEDGTFVSMDDCKGDFDLDLESMSLEDIDEKLGQMKEVFNNEMNQSDDIKEPEDTFENEIDSGVQVEPVLELNSLEELFNEGGLDGSASDIADSGVVAAVDPSENDGYVSDGNAAACDPIGQDMKKLEQCDSKKKNKDRKK